MIRTFHLPLPPDVTRKHRAETPITPTAHATPSVRLSIAKFGKKRKSIEKHTLSTCLRN